MFHVSVMLRLIYFLIVLTSYFTDCQYNAFIENSNRFQYDVNMKYLFTFCLHPKMKEGPLEKGIFLKCIFTNPINKTIKEDIYNLSTHFKVLSNRNITLFAVPDSPRHTEFFMTLADLGKYDSNDS